MLKVRLTHKNLPERVCEFESRTLKLMIHRGESGKSMPIIADNSIDEENFIGYHDGEYGTFFFTHNPHTGEFNEYTNIEIMETCNGRSDP